MLSKRSEGSSVSRDWARKRRTEPRERQRQRDRGRKGEERKSKMDTQREMSEGGPMDGETMS